MNFLPDVHVYDYIYISFFYMKSLGYSKWEYMARCDFYAWLQICLSQMAS